DPEAKQWLVDRNPNSWCRAFFKMDKGCAAYGNSIFESYHNPIRITRGNPLITMLEEIRVYLMQRLYVRKGDDSYGVNIENRTCACKWWDLSGVPLGGSSMWPQTLKGPPLPLVLRKIPGLNKKSCKKEKQPKLNVEKRVPGRKKDGSNFVFQAGPSVADPSSADPSVVYPSSAGHSVADPSSAGPSVADSTGSGTQSKISDTAKIIEDAIVTGRLKTAGLKRRCKKDCKKSNAYVGKEVQVLVLRMVGMWMKVCRITGSSHTQLVEGEPRWWLRLDDEEDILGFGFRMDLGMNLSDDGIYIEVKSTKKGLVGASI
ncbi:hypothetical protein Tco_1150442, partial [Tanacetum coccineum]